MPSDITLDPHLRASFAKRRVLITGAAGFIAGHLTDALLTAGAHLALVDASAATSCPALPPGSARYQLRVGEPGLDHLLRSEGPFDYIFHLAARAYAAGSVQEPGLDFTENLCATVTLLETLRQTQATGRFVFASSAAVYGDPAHQPIRESDATAPISPYGVSKLAAERYVSVYARLYGLRTDSLRLFSVYGPRQTKQVVYDLFRKLHANPDELVVLGDGSQVRDLVYVGDVVRAFLTVAARGHGDGRVYNVATGVGTSTATLAQAIIAAQDADAQLGFTGQTRQGDPERWLGSYEPLRALGWEPQLTLADGLRVTAAWFNTTVERAAEVGAA